MKKRNYGWKPDLPDHRDLYFAAVTRNRLKKLPESVDLRFLCSPVEDQGQLGSCTANALAGALEFLVLRDTKTLLDFSRLFIYYNERALEGTILFDAGARLRDGIKTLASKGACPEDMWQYDISKYRRKPPVACYKKALTYQILTYQRLDTVDQMRACLADGFPFVFGFAVYESFESAQVAKTGVAPMPEKGEKQLGGHAVMACGYDDKQKRFIVRNSWGSGWGQKGYFTLPYDYLASRDLSDDFWTIRSGEQM